MIDFAHGLGYPLSLGFVVPPIFKRKKYTGQNLLFEKSDFPILKETVKMILDKKRKGYNIIDPNSYFEAFFNFINGTNDWDCKYARKSVSGITIAPDGRLRTCSKLMDYMNYKFSELSPEGISEVRDVCMKIIEKCNPKCYSNCAYAAYYYNQHKFELIRRQLLATIKQIFMKKINPAH